MTSCWLLGDLAPSCDGTVIFNCCMSQ